MNSAVCLLDRAAKLFASRPAVEDEQRSLTYTAYRQEARAIASELLRRGSARKPIVFYLPKSVDMLCGFMGAMYAGSPYAPVDSHIPMNRLEKIVESLEPAFIVTNSELVGNLESCAIGDTKVALIDELLSAETDDAMVDAALAKVVDSDPIYIMYTSGSTGTPKGVTIPHRGIIDYADWVVSTFRFDEETVMANQAPFYFDNSTFDIYGCLLCGGKLILIPDVLMMFPVRLPEFLAEKEVTSIFWVPTVMINVANSGILETAQLPKLKNVAFCGEVMPNKQLNIWRKYLPHCTYANLYGPTEITDVCCYYIVDREYADADPLPIGKACENMRVVILTEDNKAAKVGEQGELCVIGSGVALGYWNNPEITNKVFVQNPLAGQYKERMYRTGDLAYWDQDGLIQFCGRKDNQIKLKGNRIELGEIETAAMTVEGVENAAAIAKEDGIQGFVAVGGGSSIDLAKAVNVLMTNPGRIGEYGGMNMVKNPCLPLVAIPTTAGTSSEITNVSALIDTEKVIKYVVIDNNIVASDVIADPEFTKTMPAGVTAATGMDAITHAVESYISNMASPLTGYNALAGLKILYNNLPKAVADGTDMDAREQMMLGCIITGFSFSNANLGFVHAIAHTLSAHFGLAHGMANACVLPYVMAYNAEACPEKMVELAKAIDLPVSGDMEKDKYLLADALKGLCVKLGIRTLREQNVPEEAFDRLAEDVLREPVLGFNPRQGVTREDVIEILRKAY